MNAATPSKLPSWLAELQEHKQAFAGIQMQDMFAKDAQRFTNFLVTTSQLRLDFSKQIISTQSLKIFADIAEQAGLKQAIDAQFNGDLINNTEARAALHSALRAPLSARPPQVAQLIEDALQKMFEFAAAVNSGSWLGHTGQPIRDIVNIGIGGSDLGPKMTVKALAHYQQNPELSFHFVSNVDPTDLRTTLSQCKPETTLFIVASKTFTTQETLSNAKAAKDWLLGTAPETAIAKHFVAISTNAQQVTAFGIDEHNMFPMWDWVGGRYSVWSAIGLPLCIALGQSGFEDFLRGAYELDQHFQETPFEKNAPVLMALLSIWYSECFGTASHALLCYEDYLDLFPDYLQQLDMESNGKNVDKQGHALNYKTGIPVWGNIGTNSQHSFHQLLHQGNTMLACDFLVGTESCNPCNDQQAQLYSNCLAQSQALMQGRSEETVIAELKNQGLNDQEAAQLAPHKIITGNKPSTTLVYKKLTPAVLGQLIALYEQKIFTQSVIWNINPFDQWGVELGKKLSQSILPALSSEQSAQQENLDSSTQGLIDLFHQ